jgi:ABC-2 type transport system permease protein
MNMETGNKYTKWKDLVLLLVQRDLRVRYRGSILGYLWSMMNPLLTMIILTFVFSQLMRFKVENFAMFILSGILTWNVFHQGLSIGVNSILANCGLLRKVNVPAAIFPLASVASVLVNFLLALVPFSIVAAVTGLKITLWILMLPIYLVPLLVFTYGCGLTLASLNVKYRDVSHLLDPVLTMVFYATPIIYPVSVLPEKYSNILMVNPMSHFVELMRSALYTGTAPNVTSLYIVYGLAIAVLVMGLFTYRTNRDKFIYHL